MPRAKFRNCFKKQTRTQKMCNTTIWLYSCYINNPQNLSPPPYSTHTDATKPNGITYASCPSHFEMIFNTHTVHICMLINFFKKKIFLLLELLVLLFLLIHTGISKTTKKVLVVKILSYRHSVSGIRITYRSKLQSLLLYSFVSHCENSRG